MSQPPIIVRPDPDLADLIPGFLSNRRADLERIQAMLAAKDTAALRRIGHDLKGCGAAYGFEPISTFGAQLEKAAVASDFAAAGAVHAGLVQYLARVEVRFD